MMGRNRKIVRMDDWDKEKAIKESPRCELRFRPSLHRYGSIYYTSLYNRTRSGSTLTEIKEDIYSVLKMSVDLCKFLEGFIVSLDGWCIITTPRRRHFDGFHLATQVCQVVSGTLGIPFHEGAVQCLTRQRIEPEFHNLFPIPEKKVIIFDDIITTGSTMKATVESIGERDMILTVIGINNR